MQDWPSLNQVQLIGKVSNLRRIQWSDGSSTAWFRLATKKTIITPQGFRTGYDHHEVEVSPGERMFNLAWDGAIVFVRGSEESFRWTPQGGKEMDRHQITATGLQLVLPSEKPKGPLQTFHRNYRPETRRTVEQHSHERTVLDGEA